MGKSKTRTYSSIFFFSFFIVEVIDKEHQGNVYKELNGKDGSRPIPSKMDSRPPNLA